MLATVHAAGKSPRVADGAAARRADGAEARRLTEEGPGADSAIRPTLGQGNIQICINAMKGKQMDMLVT